MTTNLIKPSRIDFDKVDINQIQRILSTGTLEALAPDEREYYSLMEMVRGLRARMRINGKGRHHPPFEVGTLRAFGLDGPPGVRRQSQFLLYAG